MEDEKWEALKLDYAEREETENSSSTVELEDTDDSNSILEKNLEMKDQLAKDMEAEQPLKCCVVGRRAMGKSSFINTFLNKKLGDEDYAEIRNGVTTISSKLYAHSQLPLVTMCDTPGVGTLDMTREMFIKTVHLATFDFFFIIFDNVLESEDLWVAEKLTHLNKPFCLIRCKLDKLVDSIECKRQININPAIDKLKKELMSTMNRFDVLKNKPTFLVSNFQMYLQYGDWTNLLLLVAEQIPRDKRNVLFCIFPVFTPETLTKKYEEMRSQIGGIAITAGIAGAIPILGDHINNQILYHEVSMYREVLGLNSDFATYYNPDETQITENEMQRLKMVSMSQVNILPSLFGSAVSVYRVSCYLNAILHRLHEEALKLYQKVSTTNKS